MAKKAVKKRLVKVKDWNAWCWLTGKGELAMDSSWDIKPSWAYELDDHDGKWVKVLIVEVK